MDRDNKLFLGKILGEIFRIQRGLENIYCPASDAQVFALLNGFEHVIDEVLERVDYISREKLTAVIDILDSIWSDKEKLAEFNGYYKIEEQLKQKGISRDEAHRIITYLKANHQFTTIIEKMDSSNSPLECRNFDLNELDL